MRRAHRLSARLIRWTSLSVCFALVLSCLSVTPFTNIGSNPTVLAQGRGGNARKGSPAAGPPSAVLPDLDEVQRRRHETPRAPLHLPSTLRSRRKPLEPRRGRKVGDPLPPVVPVATPSPLVTPTPRVVTQSERRPIANNSLNLLAFNFGAPNLSFQSPSFRFLNQLNPLSDSPFSLRLLPARSANTTFDFLVAPVPQAGSSKIAFTSVRDGFMQIYLMNADGSGQARLTTDGSNNDNPRWSPNGAKILFQSDRNNPGSGNFDIYMMNADGSGQTRLTIDANDDSMATWSPDGTKISFQSLRNGSFYQVYSMNADGSNQVNLTNTSASDGEPSWSPDGTKIVLASDRDRAGFDSVYVMNSNGTNQHRITFSSGDIEDTQPVWSRDGSRIAFVSTRDSILETWQETDDNGIVINKSKLHINKEVYVMNADGSGQARLTNDLANDDSPSWSPDGSEIVFRSDRERDCCDPSAQVWTMNADGTSQVNVSSSGNGDYSASWTVVGNQSPIANAGGPYTGVTAQTITLNGGGSFDPDGSIAGYAWNFGDGGTGSGISPTHVYPTVGTYNVTLTVTDNSGASASASSTATITAANQPPVANAGGPYSAATAQSITFNGGGSIDPDGTIAGYSWSFGDGGTGSGVSPIHAYSAPGAYNVALTVTDNLGLQASATTSATITTATANYYTQNFIQVALARPPNPDEVNYWEDIFRAAYAHQQGSMMIAVREMARTIFESAAYVARGRDNHWYVYDLYETYLMRYPDGPGWAFWEGQCNAYGREQVRRAFDECGEFAGNVAAIQPNGAASSGVYSLQSSRVNPENQPGNQVLARDAEWSASLLSLPGRAGLDLGLGLSYSSAVWTKSGPYAYFDEDIGTPSAGFRLGFPTVEEVFFDAQAGVNVRPLITSSGRRVELRQVGTTNVYEAADSSYLQLIDNGNNVTVRSTDGTQMSYVKLQDEWRCTEIKDRNGNYITVNNNWRGDIENITDTLGRVIMFNYDTNANLISITQNGRTQPWVTFGWGTVTMQPTLTGVVGTFSNEVIPVLTMVGFADSTYDKFTYNSSGQVTRVTHYASDSNPATDNHELAHTVFNYAAADDATRLSNIHVWGENWTGINGVPAEVVTQYGLEGAKHTLSVVGDPNTTVYKESYGTAWKRGLTTDSEVWAGGAQQKVTTTSWTQDNPDPSFQFQTNPRVTQTQVVDSAGNHKLTTIGYDTFTLPNGTSCSLPNDVYEYDGTTVVRRSHTDYNKDSNYLNNRIIGLPQAQLLYEGAATLMSKTTYVYDLDGEYLQGLPEAPIQHYGNYSTDFVVGRGNLVKVLRWDVSDQNGSAKTESKMGYNIAGSVIFMRNSLNDPDHQTSISYNDAFAVNGTILDAPRSFKTYAYPTKVTDPDQYSSSVRYRYDFGAVTWKQTPQPNEVTNQPGPQQTFEYDPNTTRLKQVTSLTNGAYTRYDYGPNYVHTYSTVNTAADEAYSAQVFDGLGRVIAAVRNHPHPDGSSSYSAVVTVYDRMGRAIQQSNPTETTASGSPWPAVGDDAYNAQTGLGGWRYTQQTYDWKSRPLVTTNTDSTTKSASYGGCGCAGGQVVTFTDEVGRRQKVYSDVLSRNWKSESLNWDGSIYSTTTKTLNARDQVTLIHEQETSSTYQDTVMTYDGYGRLKTKHVPAQGVGLVTTWDYNSDDTIQKLTDARGATSSFGYNNNRKLVTSISYLAPSGISGTPAVNYAYDAAGNRTAMIDGLGSIGYQYDSLSQVTSETRTFTDPNNAAINGVTRTLSYDYNLAGEMKKITDPTNTTISYNYDQTGRLGSIVGADNLYAGVTQYASGFQYRAWGALKHLAYGNGVNMNFGHNERLQISRFEAVNSAGQMLIGKEYQYTSNTLNNLSNDGRLKYSRDLVTNQLDRTYRYDHVGRLVEGVSGAEARQIKDGGADDWSNISGPYWQLYNYDEGNQLSYRVWRTWENTNGEPGVYHPWRGYDYNTYANNRVDGWQYDLDGRLTSNVTISGGFSYSYDAAGQLVSAVEPGRSLAQSLDGDGRRIKLIENTTVTYHLRSSALGNQVISELDQNGSKLRTYVYAAGKVPIARQESNQVEWENQDPSDASVAKTSANGTQTGAVELDPLGVLVDNNWAIYASGRQIGYNYENGNGTFGSFDRWLGRSRDSSMACYYDGVSAPCTVVLLSLNSGAAKLDTTRPSDPFGGINASGAGGQFQWMGDDSRDTGSVDLDKVSVTIRDGGGGQFVWVPSGGESSASKQNTGRAFAHAQKPQNPLSGVMGGAKGIDPVQFLPNGGSYGDNGETWIRSILDSLLQNEPCRRAFEIVGLQTINQTVKNGVVIGPATLLRNPANNEMMGIVEGARQAYNNQFGTSSAQGATINQIPGQPNPFARQRDHRPRMFFAPTAFTNLASLREVMVHEFIHAGGQPPISSWFGHDLSNYEWYDFLQKACK